MNAIRRDEALDNLHSIYVDQWDWEKVIVREDRTQAYLEKTVQDIVHAVCDTLDEVQWQFPQLSVQLERSVTFVTSQQLEDRWPSMTPKQRENAICRQCCTVFIGAPLASGTPHDGRAPDYDDWQLNGDILFWHEPLGCAMEISSGIRVDAESLAAQLKAAGEARAQLAFHKALLEGKLPLTIGGGIGQSRLCMLMLGKAHVGEVQVSLWDGARLRRGRCAAAVTVPAWPTLLIFQRAFGAPCKRARAAVTLREPFFICFLCTQSRLYQLFTACSAKAGSSSISSFVPSAKTAVPSNRPNIWWQQLFTTTARIRVVRSKLGSASNPACPRHRTNATASYKRCPNQSAPAPALSLFRRRTACSRWLLRCRQSRSPV